MTTSAIDKELAQETVRLSEARAQVAKAAAQLAKEPTDPQLRIAVVQAQQAAAEVQVGIDALNAARMEGKKADTEEAGETYRAETLAMFNRAKALLAECEPASERIDTALATLRDAVDAWKVVSSEASNAANEFCLRLYGTHASCPVVMESTVLNALADQFHEAVNGISGTHYYLTFNHTRRIAGVAESAKKDAQGAITHHLETLEAAARMAALYDNSPAFTAAKAAPQNTVAKRQAKGAK